MASSQRATRHRLIWVGIVGLGMLRLALALGLGLGLGLGFGLVLLTRAAPHYSDVQGYSLWRCTLTLTLTLTVTLTLTPWRRLQDEDASGGLAPLPRGGAVGEGEHGTPTGEHGRRVQQARLGRV